VSRAADRPEIVLTCCGCGTRTPVASVHIGDDGDPVITGRRPTVESVRYSFVHDLAEPPARPDVPQKVILYCGRGHELQVNVRPIMAELAQMAPRRIRRAV
jgi:hypothetical protein